MKYGALVLLAACGGSSPGPDASPPPLLPEHSSSIVIDHAGANVYVVNADLDSISAIDTHAPALVAEIALGPRPAVDGAGNFTPAVMPRAIAITPDDGKLYVTGERSGMLYEIEVASRAVRAIPACSEPVGVLVSADASSVYVACSQDNVVLRVDAGSFAITGRIPVANEPWGLAWSTSDGALVVTHLLTPTLESIDTGPFAVSGTVTLPDIAPRGDRRLAHGQPRGMYDVAARPGGDQLVVAHVLLGTDTAQPDLDFESTVFPAVSLLAPGTYRATLSIDAQDIPGVDGALADIVSGPHALAVTSDGAFALVVDTNSEDILAVDLQRNVQAALLRPLPGHMPEGIALAPDGSVAYIDERNTNDVAVVHIDRTSGIALAVGATIQRLASPDPMPGELRLGQHMFYSANSDESPITRNHWVACASCHLEGRSDAVTWRFEQGPRDTPTNAGGMLGTGFLFRTAARNKVQDYWHTINIEQGGTFDPVDQAPLLDAITAYVNHGIPLPVPPTTDPVLVAQGKEIFERPDVGCAGCHSGPRFTDSGAGNPTLDLSGVINLHDVGTCVHAGYPDVASSDVEGHPRAACLFDAPSLSGLASTPPYLHDGSAATIHDVLELTRGKMGNITALSAEQETALVEYLRSL